MMKRKIMALGAAGILSITLIIFVFFSLPANSITFDVNPSIEITTNRLNNVLSVKPLNKEAEKLLEDFTVKDKDLNSVVNDLVDLMILTGYISGGRDNLVMITVKDDNADQVLLDKVNQRIAAYLENKQIEATVLGHTISYSNDDRRLAADNAISPGKLELIKKIMAREKGSSIEELTSISLQEILTIAEKLNINPDELFEYIIKDIAAYSDGKYGDNDTQAAKSNSLLGREKALEIALGLTGGGQMVKFEMDEDDGRYKYEIYIVKDGRKYEVEIDAYTGKVLEFDAYSDNKYGNNDTQAAKSNSLLGREKAR